MTEYPRLEQAIADLRREMVTRLDSVDARILAASTQSAAAQAQIVAHTAVCEERQRLIERRQEDRRLWMDERAEEWRAFMDESRKDRAAIRDSVSLNGWRILIAVVVANLLASIGTVLASKPALLAGIH